MPSLSLPRAVELSIDCGAKGRRSRRCNWLRLCAAVTAAGLPLPCGDYPPYRTVPYLHCAAPSGAPTGRPGFNPADLRGVQPAVQLADRVDERSGFAHRRRTHLPEAAVRRRDRFGGINRSHSFGRPQASHGRRNLDGLCRRAVPHTLPQSTRTPQHTTAHHSIRTNGTLRPPCRRPWPKGRSRCAAAVRRSTHGVLTAAAVLCSTPKW